MVCQREYPELESVPCASFEDVFAAVEGIDGAEPTADLAMIPIDNSLAGRVADIHHFLPSSSLHIIAEHFLRIRFHLMALPGVSLADVRTVHSHVHALGQCRKVIREHGLTPVISGDTAGAAREIAEAGDPSMAAISRRWPPRSTASTCSPRTSRTRTTTPPASWCSPATSSSTRRQRPRGHELHLQRAQHPRRALQALGGFATNGVNMTKLESYMVDGHFTATQFLAEVDGHPDDVGLKHALEELAFFTTDVKILGVYPASPQRA